MDTEVTTNTPGNIRDQFPALQQSIHGYPLVYLDTAATALKPLSVISKVEQFYKYKAANVHRGAHFLSSQATNEYEKVREQVSNWIGAQSPDEIIFTSGTTDSINLVAVAVIEKTLNPGDEIILTEMEHHANIVPWQIVAKRRGAVIKWVPVLPSGELNLSAYTEMLSKKVRVVSVTHCSNSIGTINPIQKIVSLAKKQGALVLVDAAQSVMFEKLDVRKLDCDFLAFSAHKLYGPYGVGILYGRKELMDAADTYRVGGATIDKVTKEETTFLNSPQKFEAGTPNISGVIGMGEAIRFVQSIGVTNIRDHESRLTELMIKKLGDLPGVEVIGSSAPRVNILSIVVKDAHASDLGSLLDQQGVAVRVGHHCNMPLMNALGFESTLRISFGVYNNDDDVNKCAMAIRKALEILK